MRRGQLRLSDSLTVGLHPDLLLHQLFAGLPMAEKGILICKDSARRPSGEGYCVFADEEAALEALKKDNASMGHRLAWSEGLNISNPFRSIRLLFPFSYSSATACQSTVPQL